MEVQLLITRREAAALLNMSLSHFQRHVQAQLPCVCSGQLRLYRCTDVEHWVEDQLHSDLVIPSSGDIGFTEAHEGFVADCRAGAALNKHGRAYRPKAIVNLDSSLRRLPVAIRRKPLVAVRRGELQEAVDGFRREGLSASRVTSIINAVRSLYRWAIDRERAAEDPASLVRLPAAQSGERDRIAAPWEFARLLAHLEPPDALPWALAAYGTARLQEIQALAWTEVDLGHELMLLAADEEARKSVAAPRLVPLATPLRRRLSAEWTRQGRPGSGKVCPPRARSRSGLLSLGQLSKRVRSIWEESDLCPIGLQDSRHTAATWLDHAGVSPRVCSMMMGHRAPRRDLYPEAAPITLRRYTHVLPGELERGRDQLDKFLAAREEEEKGKSFKVGSTE
jgi:integrase